MFSDSFRSRMITKAVSVQKSFKEPLIPGYSVYGIDVSKYQSDIEWENLRVSKTKDGNYSDVCFMFLKATQGNTGTDPYFPLNFSLAKKHGYLVSAYHLLTPDFSAEEQAEMFLSEIDVKTLDFPPILDFEKGIYDKLKTVKARRRFVKLAEEWLSIVAKKTGVTPIVYASDNSHLKDLSDNMKLYKFWIARYTDEPPVSHQNWLFWQFSEHGYANGIKSQVDLDVFNGSYEEFIEYSNTYKKMVN